MKKDKSEVGKRRREVKRELGKEERKIMKKQGKNKIIKEHKEINNIQWMLMV